MDETIFTVALQTAAIAVLIALLYGAYRAFRSPLQPLATFVRAWATALTVFRVDRSVALFVLGGLVAGQALQTFFHFYRVLSDDTLIVVSTIWQLVLAVFMALCGARFQLGMIPVVTFRPADADARARFRKIALWVALWAGLIWLANLGLTVLSNLAVANSAPDWRWYVAVPMPMLVYLLMTPSMLIRPALVFGQSGAGGVPLAFRYLWPLLWLNFLFTLPPFLYTHAATPLLLLAGLRGAALYVIGSILFVCLAFFSFLAYEAATQIVFAIATGKAPRIVFNKTFTGFYPRRG